MPTCLRQIRPVTPGQDVTETRSLPATPIICSPPGSVTSARSIALSIKVRRFCFRDCLTAFLTMHRADSERYIFGVLLFPACVRAEPSIGLYGCAFVLQPPGKPTHHSSIEAGDGASAVPWSDYTPETPHSVEPEHFDYIRYVALAPTASTPS